MIIRLIKFSYAIHKSVLKLDLKNNSKSGLRFFINFIKREANCYISFDSRNYFDYFPKFKSPFSCFFKACTVIILGMY